MLEMSKTRYILIVLLLSVTTILSHFFFQYKTVGGKYDTKDIVDQFQHTFLQRQNSAESLLKSVTEQFREHNKEGIFYDSETIDRLHDKYYQQGEIVFITRNDSVLFLSHNSLPITHNQLPEYTHGLNFLSNGWYYVNKKTIVEYDLWVASVVKHRFPYKNQFLENVFQEDYTIPDFVGIAYDSTKGEKIVDNNQNYLLSLLIDEDQLAVESVSVYWHMHLIFSVISFVLLLFLLVGTFEMFFSAPYRLYAVGGLLVSILLLRLGMFYFQIPEVFYEGELFSPRYYATSYFLPSLGDLLLHIVFINVCLFYVFVRVPEKSLSIAHQKSSMITIVVFLITGMVALAAESVLSLLKGLVINSNLALNVNFIFQPSIYDFIGFLTIGGIFTAYFFLGKIAVLCIRSISIPRNRFYTIISGSLAVWAGLVFVLSETPYLMWLLLFIIPFIFLLQSKPEPGKISYTFLILVFFIFALISTYALYAFNSKKELSERQSVALRIASEQDPVAEFLFHEMEPLLFDDVQLQSMVLEDPYNETDILNYLLDEYFNEFWAKYDIQLTSCSPYEVLYFQHIDEEMECAVYFDYYIQNFGRPTIGEHFIYLDNNTGRNSYISVVPVRDSQDENILYQLYIEFESKFIPRELGFPELLIDEEIDITRNIGEYSYAIYKDEVMTHKFGPYFYSIHAHTYPESEQTFTYFESDGYHHLRYQQDDKTTIVVSKPQESLLKKIAPFSYLFIVFVFLITIVWFIHRYYNQGHHLSLNFKKRIQISVIGIVLLSVISIGSASAWFIFNIHKNKNESLINEKAHSILIEVENRLGEEPYLDTSYSDYLEQMLLGLSNVFFTDINIFDPSGNLLASSRPKVFEEGLIAPLIHPLAHHQLIISGKSLFIHNEKIGNLEYLSAYIPLTNFRGDLMAYINLPYFAQQSELRNEISYFLVAFINIYLLLLLLSIIIAFFISNHVTRPLQIIRNSISRLSIGKLNEKINWKRKDEIGQLVSEYNRMVDELAVSAELLAKSERETAWREMARQVAHEIKNPLTPMRLNVQYLQRAWKDQVDDWDDRLERFTQSMVEQIDNLNIIASEFSDFAKMPPAKNELIDLRTFVPQMLDIYKGFENVRIEYSFPDHKKPLNVSVDRKQLLRVFNNLIKNAIQSYQKDETALIHIDCSEEEGYYKVVIQDFGDGIPDDLKKNIFQPYFTTKTSGMGLGLAMVKSIINSFNGYVSFESKENKGTRFILRIPANDPPETIKDVGQR